MTQFIKLLHDEHKQRWICGDEDGKLMIVTNEYLEDALFDWQSKSLQRKVVRGGCESLTIILAVPEFGSAEIVTLQTLVIGSYVVHAGFSKRCMIWAVADSFNFEETVTT